MQSMRAVPLVAVLFIVAMLSPARSQGAMAPWRPADSYADGAQPDPRLDQPVDFWGAAMALEDVFADAEAQTGVHVGFYPENDENRQLRVHVFLSEDQPPTLRDLLVQLSWVVDCPFSVADEGGQPVYYLMGTSIGRGASEVLRAREQQKRRETEETRQAVLSKLAELGEALNLPREEAIRRYQGSDDRALLDMLDPRHRAATQIAVMHVPEWLASLKMEPAPAPPAVSGYGLGYGASEMFEGEQQQWVTAFGMDLNGWEFQDSKVCFGVGATTDGEVNVHGPLIINDAGQVVPSGRYSTDRYTVLDLSPRAALKPEEEITLRRALGEQISAPEEKAFLDRRKSELAAAARVAQAEASGASLSPAAEGLLSSAPLDLAGGNHSAWRIEEAVALATGMNVVSDGLLYASAGTAPAGQPLALATLEALCSQPAKDFMRTPEWEWGDAGSFLRFRTSNRDVWRAARLPAATQTWLDKSVRPFLPATGEDTRPVDFSLTVDPRQCARQLSDVTDMQILYGGRVLQGDPYDPAEAARRAVWQGLSQYAQAGRSLLRFLADMDDAQWALARAGKLRSPEDVTPDQSKLLTEALTEKVIMTLPAGSYTRLRVSLDQGEIRQFPGGSVGLMSWTYSQPGEPMHGGGMDTLVGGLPKACHRATLSAFTVDQATGKENMVFEKRVTFLPTALSVHVELPE